MAAVKAEFIRQGTTPEIQVSVSGEDLTGATVYVTLEQAERQITKSNYNGVEDVTAEVIEGGTLLRVKLSQAETLWLRPGPGRVQVRWVYEDGEAHISDCGYIKITPALLKGVISHG